MPRKIGFLFMLLVHLPALGFTEQGQEGHGGDIAVSLFLGVMRQTISCLRENPNSWNSQPRLLQDLQTAMTQTQVISVEKTLLNHVEVDAINYPNETNPQILVNRSRWLNTRLDTELRSHLVLHEYLSIAGYQDQEYEISYKLIQTNSTCLRREEP